MLNYESIPVTLPSTDHLHLTRFFHDQKNLGTPVFMLHTTLHDGKMFFSDEGTGLACYLARQGYDVYVADLRGKGKSWPQVSAASRFGNHHSINEDIPALLEKIVAKRGAVPQIWIGHGWGSVLMCSFYARFGPRHAPVSRMVHFAARRKIHQYTLRKNLLINGVWKKLARLLIPLTGYLPVKLLRLGSSNESRGSYEDYLSWSSASRWCDRVDDFDYSEALQQQGLPPSFYFAAAGDRTYGDPADVRAFVRELGQHDGRLMVLSKQGGNLHNYNHLDMVCHKDCENDHFPVLVDWLSQA